MPQLKANIVMSPASWELKRASGSAYYILLIGVLEGRYYLIQRHGKMAAKYSVSPFFDGLPIGEMQGYGSVDEAFAAGDMEIQKKLKQIGEKQYLPLGPLEALIYDNKDGRQFVNLYHHQERKLG